MVMSSAAGKIALCLMFAATQLLSCKKVFPKGNIVLALCTVMFSISSYTKVVSQLSSASGSDRGISSTLSHSHYLIAAYLTSINIP